MKIRLLRKFIGISMAVAIVAIFGLAASAQSSVRDYRRALRIRSGRPCPRAGSGHTGERLLGNILASQSARRAHQYHRRAATGLAARAGRVWRDGRHGLPSLHPTGLSLCTTQRYRRQRRFATRAVDVRSKFDRSRPSALLTVCQLPQEDAPG